MVDDKQFGNYTLVALAVIGLAIVIIRGTGDVSDELHKTTCKLQWLIGPVASCDQGTPAAAPEPPKGLEPAKPKEVQPEPAKEEAQPAATDKAS
jgi:hypothetical protein